MPTAMTFKINDASGVTIEVTQNADGAPVVDIFSASGPDVFSIIWPVEMNVADVKKAVNTLAAGLLKSRPVIAKGADNA